MNRPRISAISHKINTIDLRQGSSAATERIRGGRLRKIRQDVLLRDEYTCQVCGRVTRDLEIDHIVPLHLGGKETEDNRQAICRDCHRKKTEQEGGER